MCRFQQDGAKAHTAKHIHTVLNFNGNVSKTLISKYKELTKLEVRFAKSIGTRFFYCVPDDFKIKRP